MRLMHGHIRWRLCSVRHTDTRMLTWTGAPKRADSDNHCPESWACASLEVFTIHTCMHAHRPASSCRIDALEATPGHSSAEQ